MKGILEFNLDEPFETLAFVRASNATNAYLALYDLSNMFRSVLKNGELSEEVETYVEKLRDQFYDTLEKNHIRLDDLE